MATTLTAAQVDRTSASQQPKQSFDWKNLWPLLKETFADWSKDNAMRLSAALALYAVLSLAPLLVISIKIMSIVLNKNAASTQVQGQMVSLIGPAGADAIKEMIQNSAQKGSGVIATTISTILLLFAAAGVFGELQDSMNTIWQVKARENQGVWGWIRNRFLSMAMVFGIAFLLLVSMFISTLLTTVAGSIAGKGSWIGAIVDIVVSLVALTALFAAIFKFLPDAKIDWKDVWLGALLTSALFTVGKYGLSLYFKFGTPQSAFGAAGSFAAVLLWVYYSSWILFFGAEFTQVYTKRHGRWIEPSKNAKAVNAGERAVHGMDVKTSPVKSAGKDESRRRPPRLALPRPAYSLAAAEDHPARQYALAAGGVVVGAVAGALGANYLLNDPRRPARKHVQAVELDRRLRAIEHKLGRVSRIKQYLQDMHVKERINEVERRVRSASTTARAQATGRPRWLVRVQDALAGR
jgi:membrane protein